MLPGLIAGHYDYYEVHIDLAPLARAAGARLYHDEVIGLDLDGGRVLCHARPPVTYDVLSLDSGITPAMAVPGAAEHAVAVKPVSSFWARWQALRARVATRRAAGTRGGVTDMSISAPPITTSPCQGSATTLRCPIDWICSSCSQSLLSPTRPSGTSAASSRAKRCSNCRTCFNRSGSFG